MKYIIHRGVLIVLGISLVLVACVGGGGGGSSSSGLTGSWKGNYHDFNGPGPVYEMDTVVNGMTITSVSLGGASTGDTGTLAVVQNNIYEYSLSPSGGYGGFMVDSSSSHAALLDLATPGMGVLQKGASAIPTYGATDVGGNWSGYSVHLDAAEYVDSVDTTSVTVDGATWAFSGIGPSGAFTGVFTDFVSSVGIWYGTYVITSSAVTGNIYAYLSPDKNFAASWACDGGVIPPSVDCSYHAWNRQ